MDTLGFGIILWIIGFALGMMFFTVMPASMIGLFVIPVMIVTTIFVAYKRLKDHKSSNLYFLLVAVVWVVIAIVFDYIFLVEGFSVENYYDFDAYLYYVLAFVIPLIIGLKYGKKI